MDTEKKNPAYDEPQNISYEKKNPDETFSDQLIIL